MQNNFNSEKLEDGSLTIKEQFKKYLSHWKWFLVSVLFFAIGAKLYLRYTVPEYKSTTTILIKDENSGGLASELSAFEDMGLFTGSKNVIDDEIEILKSRTLVEKTVKAGKFNISYISEGRIRSSDAYSLSPLEIIFDSKKENFHELDTLLNVNILSAKDFELHDQNNSFIGKFSFGQKINSDKLGVYKIVKRTVIGDDQEIISINEGKIEIHIVSSIIAAESFRRRMNVSTINKKTNVIEISYVDQVNKRADDFLNLLVKIYNDDAVADKNFISEKTANFIDDRLKIITKELDGVEKEVESYKKSNKITDLPTEAELYLKKASEFKTEEVTVGTQLKIVDIMLNHMRSSKGSDVIPANIIPSDNNAALLIAEYNALVVEKDRILKSSTAENPAVLRLNDKINSLKSNVAQSLIKLKSSLQVKNNDFKNHEGVLSSKISQIPRQEREYRGIFRQQQIKEELYLYLFKKREETAISLAGTAPISKIVDEAYTSKTPISPNKNFVYLTALIFSLLVPFAIIYLKELLDTKVKNRHDLEKIGIPFVGDVPHSDSHNEIIQPNSRTSSAEAIRIVRTNLEFILNTVVGDKAKTIFLTSTLPKEGKTFITVNLAGTIAISGKKVLLIGMDIRNPKLNEYLDLPSRGVTNFLSANKANINDFIVKQKGYDHFDILPAGVIPPNPAELLMSKKVEEMFKELKENYDYIVVDTAPVSLVTDTLLISQYADSFIYVVRAKYLEKGLLRIPEALYKDKKLPNMCVLLNDTDTVNGYGYGYGVEIEEKPWYKKFFGFIPFLG